jgi:hypothetical protein
MTQILYLNKNNILVEIKDSNPKLYDFKATIKKYIEYLNYIKNYATAEERVNLMRAKKDHALFKLKKDMKGYVKREEVYNEIYDELNEIFKVVKENLLTLPNQLYIHYKNASEVETQAGKKINEILLKIEAALKEIKDAKSAKTI